MGSVSVLAVLPKAITRRIEILNVSCIKELIKKIHMIILIKHFKNSFSSIYIEINDVCVRTNIIDLKETVYIALYTLNSESNKPLKTNFMNMNFS